MISKETNLTHRQIDKIINDCFNIAITELQAGRQHHFINMVRMKYTPPRPSRQGVHAYTKKVTNIRAKKASLKLFPLRKFKITLADILERHWLR